MGELRTALESFRTSEMQCVLSERNKRIAALEAEVKRLRTEKEVAAESLAAVGPSATIVGLDDEDMFPVVHMEPRDSYPVVCVSPERLVELKEAAAEVERLRGALKAATDLLGENGYGKNCGCPGCNVVRDARAALEPEEVSNEMPEV